MCLYILTFIIWFDRESSRSKRTFSYFMSTISVQHLFIFGWPLLRFSPRYLLLFLFKKLHLLHWFGSRFVTDYLWVMQSLNFILFYWSIQGDDEIWVTTWNFHYCKIPIHFNELYLQILVWWVNVHSIYPTLKRWMHLLVILFHGNVDVSVCTAQVISQCITR